MRRLVSCTLLMIFVNLVLIVLSRGLGGSRVDTYAEYLRTTECRLPCWIDIYPGITGIDDAEARIYQVYGLENRISDASTGYDVSSKRNEGSFQLKFSYWQGEMPEQRRFHEIVFSPCRNCLTVGSALNLFGAPTRVFPASQTVEDKFTALIYDEANLVIHVAKANNCDAISEYQMVVVFAVYSHIPAIDFEPGSEPWRGFGTCYSDKPR